MLLLRSYSENNVTSQKSNGPGSSKPSRSASSTSLHNGHGHSHIYSNGHPPPPPPPLPTSPQASGSSSVFLLASRQESLDGHPHSRSSQHSDSSTSLQSMMSKRTAAIQDLAAVSTIIGEKSQSSRSTRCSCSTCTRYA